MKSEHSKNNVGKRPEQHVRRAAPYVLVSSFFAAGLLLFAGQSANAQDTTIAPEATMVANEAATATTLAAGEVMAPDSTLVAAADTAIATLDSTPVGGMETGFGGTASEPNSNHSGLYFAGAAGVIAVGALGLRKFSKQSTGRSDRSQPK